MPRKIYINPGEMIEFRFINDDELPKNATEWRYQTRPRSALLIFHGYEKISAADPAIYMDHEFTLNK